MVLSVATEKMPSDTTVRLVPQCLNHYATSGPIYLRYQSEITRNLQHDNWSPDQQSNPGTSRYEAALLCCQGPPAIRWWPLTAFPFKILDNVSSIGSGAGIAASSRMGSTSKGTKVSNLYKQFK